jgi:YidC/Oxa1 family membrane protein insertase
MNAILDVIAIPLGFLLKLIYNVIPNYYIAIFLFVLLTRILLFPLSLKTQKGMADRARLAPRLEQIQKKYAKDQKKMQEKQSWNIKRH